jgi:tetratricopeptide (TPR) repeat protein
MKFKICLLIIVLWLTQFLLIRNGFSVEEFSYNETTIKKWSNETKATDYPGRAEKLAERARIYHEARRLEKQGLFEDALKKYQEALDPRLIDIERDKFHPLLGIMDVHQLQGKYELALNEMEPFLKKNPDKPDEFPSKKKEIEALVTARDTNSSKSILKYIESVRNKHKRDLPPNRVSTYSEILFGDFAYLYDIIGDFDAGIALCDDFAKHATQKPRIQNQYLAIRKAFEEDKKEGRESYITKPGKLGRATRALMQSDYFTW